MRVTSRRFGPLTYRLVEPASARSTPPRLAVVLCHGYGAPGDDLVPLAGEIVRLAPELADRVTFAFPEAPLSLGGYGPWESRAWWPIDVEALDRAVAAGTPVYAPEAQPEGLTEARAQLQGSLDPFSTEMNLGFDRIVLGGFSQGAMLATDVALRLATPAAALALFSGTLLLRSEWTRLACGLTQRLGPRPLPRVLQSHGRQDPLLAFSAATALRDILLEAGLPVEFIPFDGPHTIPPEALQRFSGLLADLTSSD